MSDTPKYSYWHLSATERKRLAALRYEEERRQEQLMLEEAERRKNARIVAKKVRFQDTLAHMRQCVSNCVQKFSEIQSSGAELLESVQEVLENLSERVKTLNTEEVADEVDRSLKLQSETLQNVTNLLSTKQKILAELAEIEVGLAERNNLSGLSHIYLSSEKRDHLKKRVAQELKLEKALDLACKWNTERRIFLDIFQFYDQKVRYDAILTEMNLWDRSFLVGDKMHDYQQLYDYTEKLKMVFAEGRMSAVTPLLLQIENRFVALSLKLQNDVQKQKQIQTENEDKYLSITKQFNEIHKFEDKILDSGDAEFIKRIRASIKQQLFRLEQQVTHHQNAEFTMNHSLIKENLREYSEQIEQLASIQNLENEVFSCISQAHWKRFATQEYEQLRKGFQDARKRIYNRQNFQLGEMRTTIHAFLNPLLARLKPQILSYDAQRSIVMGKLNSHLDRIRSYNTDKTIQCWASEEISIQLKTIEQLQEDIESDAIDLCSAENQLHAWRQKTDKILVACREMQDKERKRQYLIKRFIEKFQELGFQVTPPYLEDEENSASGIVLTANRPEGRMVNVRFDQDDAEPVLYAVDGFPMPKLHAGNQTYRTCDDAQRHLDILHKLLEKTGILMGKIQWEDQPPVDLARETIELPDVTERTNFSDNEQ